MTRGVFSSKFILRMITNHNDSLVLLALLVKQSSPFPPMTRRRGISRRAYDVVVPAKFGCRCLLDNFQ